MKTIKMQKIAFATMLACGASLASAADWSDTSINYKYQKDSREPYNNNDIAKHTVGFTHVSGYKYGSNFLNVDAIKSDNCDPASRYATTTPQCAAVEGAQEIYLTFRTNFEYGKVNGTPLAFGPFKDVALTAGFDINTKNNPIGGNKRMWVLGPTFMTKLDKGFFNIGLFASQEANRNASSFTGVGRDTTFDVAPMLAFSWNYPLQVGLPAKFQGFFNVVGEKGKSYDGRDSTTEYFSRSSFLWDVGSGMGLKNNTAWAGVGFEYWRNKFGSPKGAGYPEVIKSPMFVAEWHF